MAGPVRFGRYVLLDKLALGGMAEIFLAKAVGEAGFEKSLVIKKVLPHLTQAPGFVEMFLDEARIAAQLSHPGIVQIFDLGKQDGDYYFAMEYLAGEDLAAMLRRSDEAQAKIPVDVAVKIGAAAAEALHYAHGLTTPDGRPMGIVHRDISPSNLFVTYHGVVKVLDFGIARAEQRLQQTRAGHVKGKAAYMAPEQARGETVDCRADVWSLGVCLHEMLTGRRLFLRDSSSETLLAVREWPIPKPSQLRPELPPELDDVVMGALEREVARRTKDAETLRRSLERYLADRTYVSQSVQLGRYLRELFGDARAETALRRANASAAVNGAGREGTENIGPALAAPAPDAAIAHAASDEASIPTDGGGDPHEVSTQVTAIPQRAVSTSVVARTRTTLADRPARRDTQPAVDLPSVLVQIDETDPGTISRTDPRSRPASVRAVIAFGAIVGGIAAAAVVAVVLLAGRAEVRAEGGAPQASATIGDGRAQSGPSQAPAPITDARGKDGADRLTAESARRDGTTAGARADAEHATAASGAEPAAGEAARAIPSPSIGVAAPIAGDGSAHDSPHASEGSAVRLAANRERRAGSSPAPDGDPRRGGVTGDAAVAPVERPRAAKPAVGHLTVRANAPVVAFLDGKKLGPVPLEGVPVGAGEHTLKLENAALGISRTAKVDIDAGRELTRVVTFSKGKMNVLVDPWADVFADGVKLGQTPLAGKELFEGRHQIRLVGPRGQKTVEVEIVGGKTVVVRESLP